MPHLSGTLLVMMLLCILAPLPGVAQSATPEAEPPSSSSPPPLVSAPETPSPAEPRGELIPHHQPTSQSPEYGIVPRVGFELVGGALGGAALGAPGAILLLAGRRCHEDPCHSLRTVGGGLLLLAGGSVGMAVGIKLAGDTLGGLGRFEVVYAFEAVALLSVAGTGGAPSLKTSEFVFAGSLFAATLVMGIVGYELTQGHSSPSTHELTSPSGWMMPTVGVSPSGNLTAGLVGSF